MHPHSRLAASEYAHYWTKGQCAGAVASAPEAASVRVWGGYITVTGCKDYHRRTVRVRALYERVVPK